MYFLKKNQKNPDISHGINSIGFYGFYVEQIWVSSFTISSSEKN